MTIYDPEISQMWTNWHMQNGYDHIEAYLNVDNHELNLAYAIESCMTCSACHCAEDINECEHYAAQDIDGLDGMPRFTTPDRKWFVTFSNLLTNDPIMAIGNDVDQIICYPNRDWIFNNQRRDDVWPDM